jgi:hypothetical protein
LAGGGFQLFFKSFQQGEGIGGGPGKTADNIAPAWGQAARLL